MTPLGVVKGRCSSQGNLLPHPIAGTQRTQGCCRRCIVTGHQEDCCCDNSNYCQELLEVLKFRCNTYRLCLSYHSYVLTSSSLDCSLLTNFRYAGHANPIKACHPFTWMVQLRRAGSTGSTCASSLKLEPSPLHPPHPWPRWLCRAGSIRAYPLQPPSTTSPLDGSVVQGWQHTPYSLKPLKPLTPFTRLTPDCFGCAGLAAYMLNPSGSSTLQPPHP